MAGRLANKVVIVTGSTQGIGKAIARLFVGEGARVVLNSAIFQRDLPLLQGTILVLAMFFVFLNLAVDVLQTALDPRIERA